jgi:hypothetical protein
MSISRQASRNTSNSDPDVISKAQTSHLEKPNHLANNAARWGNPYYGPLTHIPSQESEYLPAFGGAFQPGLYKPPNKPYANPAPLGLAGFAMTTFLLSIINLNVKGLAAPSIVVGPAFAYGGLCQLLSGMW